MVVFLIGYPEAGLVVVKGTAAFRECAPAQYEAPFIPDQSLIVGEQSRQFNVAFSQFPCFYEQTRFAVIVNSETLLEDPLPAFIVYNAQDEIIRIKQTSQDNVGEYRIKIYGVLDNYSQTVISTSFKVTVYAAIDPPVFEFLPEWYPDFVD